MVYKSRSKYTPGGGVLAFFELVSRFVSLSVLGWVVASVFFILFLSDGKITDSFDLRLVRGVFSDLQLAWTALVLIAMNGIVGGLLSLPSAVVLFLTRQYLDFYSTRSSRKGGFIRIRIVRALPLSVLILCHLTAVTFSLVSAPQLTRSWFVEGSRFSSSLTRIHFVISSLSRKSFEAWGSDFSGTNKRDSGDLAKSKTGKRHVQIFFLPAEILESEDFQSEQSKIKDAQRIPFVMTKSNLNEQIEELFSEGLGPTSTLVRKIVQSPREYNRVQKQGDSRALLAISSQLRFGRYPLGRGTDSVAQLNEDIFIHESQRRLVASQPQLFGVFRLLEGLPFLGRQMDWLDLVSDDVARVRFAARKMKNHRPDQASVSIIQLSGLERGFENINVPFRPFGWPEKISMHEKRLIIKNTLRELSQYIQDISGGGDFLWVVLPYADDKRSNPRSVAFVKPDVQLPQEFRRGTNENFGVMNVEMGRFINRFLDESAASESTAFNTQSSLSAKNTLEKIRCFESELDPESNDFRFQTVEIRQRGLSELLNFLPQLPKVDLEFLSQGTLHLVARDPGYGFICKAENQSKEDIYLIKPASYSVALKYEKKDLSNASILVSEQSSGTDTRFSASRQKSSSPRAGLNSASQTENKIFKGEILSGFKVLQFAQSASGDYSEGGILREFNQLESSAYFSKFEPETLQAFEYYARARIR